MYNNSYDNNQIDTRSATFYLIVINVLFFAVSNLLPGLFPSTLYDTAGLSRADMFLGLHYPASDYFNPIQLVTHMFMHADVFHIVFNMYGLFMFGTILERVWGPKRFLVFYFLTGFGAMGLDLAVKALEVYNISGSFAPSSILVAGNGDLMRIMILPTIGASGAVFGVLTAFAMLFPNTELMLMFVPIPIKAKYLVGGYVIMELVLGISNNPTDNIAHFAHLGGALVGFIIIKIWNKNRNSLY